MFLGVQGKLKVSGFLGSGITCNFSRPESGHSLLLERVFTEKYLCAFQEIQRAVKKEVKVYSLGTSARCGGVFFTEIE